MKLSDYVVKFIEEQTNSIFLLSGGGIMHLVDSVGKSNLNSYCCHHEQTVAIATEGYSRIKTDGIGVCLVTTGPGGTNAITGVAGAWLDSIPMLVISGQVKRDNIIPRNSNGKPLIRQLGFQELNVIDMVKPITKYAVMVENENEIKYHLEKAIYLAKDGRPGPVWIEIPLDVQATEIDPDSLRSFEKPIQEQQNDIPMNEVIQALNQAQRPLLIAGNGIRLAGGEEILWKMLDKIKINTVTPIFTADDLVTHEYSYYLGRQGMPGNKSANYAVDNCDLLLVIGERMQLTQTSYDYENFAPQSKKIMVDIDLEEMKKKTFLPDIAINCDAKVFLEKLNEQDINLSRWDLQVEDIDTEKYSCDPGFVNVYKFLEELGKHSQGYHVATANGTASLAPHQALKIIRGQRFLTNAGLGHMGSGLPLAIGACVADGKKSVICSEGDGSIMLNLQDLQTVLHHGLPLKIFIYNNNGYHSIRSTHMTYFDNVFAADPESGVSIPDFSKIIPAWGLKYERINNDSELDKVRQVMETSGPIVCELMIDPDQKMISKWSAGVLKE
ncbi:MAG: thiamine pyrophosphate-binding protein [bacterium]